MSKDFRGAKTCLDFSWLHYIPAVEGNKHFHTFLLPGSYISSPTTAVYSFCLTDIIVWSGLTLGCAGSPNKNVGDNQRKLLHARFCNLYAGYLTPVAAESSPFQENCTHRCLSVNFKYTFYLFVLA